MLHEKLSAYMDSEISTQDDRLVEQLTNDKELLKKWQNYHLIKDVMQKEKVTLLSDDFALKMESIIAAEEFTVENVEKTSIFANLMNKAKELTSKFNQGMLVQGLVTASVCLVAVVGFQHFTKDQNPAESNYGAIQTLPFNQNIAPVSLKLNNNIEINDSNKIEEAHKRLEMMLRNYEFTRRIDNN